MILMQRRIRRVTSRGEGRRRIRNRKTDDRKILHLTRTIMAIHNLHLLKEKESCREL